MPIHHALWKVSEKPTLVSSSRLSSEQLLEDMIVREPRILSEEWMIIGRQETTKSGGRIDLLAIAPDASLVLIELKRDRTPRDIAAQALDYASWVEALSPEKIIQMFDRYTKGQNLDEAFRERFGADLDEDALNASHQIVIVAAELDPATERIIGYLNARDIAINVLFFQVFQAGEDQLLSRAWLIDPGKTQANVSKASNRRESREPWNGEYYASYGSDTTWEDARKYGFISAGGGSWYSRTLNLLSPGDRVWVKIPKVGYVGVGRVIDGMTRADEYTVETSDGPRPALEVLDHAHLLEPNASDPEKAEYFVRVKWLDTVPQNQAVNEIGLFGNQNSVCQPTSPKWRHTVERLKTRFKVWKDDSA